MAPTGKRSFHEGPWHFCGRCGERVHLSEMVWQRGVLVCVTNNCLDTGTFPLVGQREEAIEKAFETPTHELEPDPKLSEPTAGNALEDDILF